ncbi:MAG: MoaD/ThiS family protein [Planctomycetota bacterium]|nr:MoaD/ThiS family protein [Planctomycetota bacterium]
MKSFSVKVEFFGVPRLRAGVADFFVEVAADRNRLGDVLMKIQREIPELTKECFADGKLRKEYVVNVSGKEFTRSLGRVVSPGDSLLIMSSDAGG